MFKDKLKDKIDEVTQENWFLSYIGKYCKFGKCSSELNLSIIFVNWLPREMPREQPYLSRALRKLTILFPNRSDTNRSVPAQEMARGWKF